jgi:hypothetical protein
LTPSRRQGVRRRPLAYVSAAQRLGRTTANYRGQDRTDSNGGQDGGQNGGQTRPGHWPLRESADHSEGSRLGNHEPLGTARRALIRSSAVGWVASSLPDQPAVALDGPCSTPSAAASSGPQPWSAANRSAANSARRHTHVSANGPIAAQSATAAATPPVSQCRWCAACATATPTPGTATIAKPRRA